MNDESDKTQVSGARAARPSESAEAAGEDRQRPGLLDRLTSFFRQRNETTLRENLEDVLAGEDDTGEAFTPAERAMLNNILRLREVRIADVMVPRADVHAVDIDTTLGELLILFEESGHSRMPVYSETLDDPRGMVHIRDVVARITTLARQKKKGARKTAKAAAPVLDLANVDLSRTIGELNLVREVLFVPPSMLASELMTRMQASRIQIAMVIDEYGGTDGIVSLEDIVEEVVGDIEDEHDEDVPMVTRTGEGVYVVDARAEIEDVTEAIGQAFADEELAEDVDTIGGLIVNALGRVPARGEVVQAIPGFEFHILDADARRIKRIRIVTQQNGDSRPRSDTAAETT